MENFFRGFGVVRSHPLHSGASDRAGQSVLRHRVVHDHFALYKGECQPMQAAKGSEGGSVDGPCLDATLHSRPFSLRDCAF